MTIHTDYHGTIEYEADELVTFSEGIFGFPSLKKFLCAWMRGTVLFCFYSL